MKLLQDTRTAYDNLIIGSNRSWSARLYYESGDAWVPVSNDVLQSMTINDYVCDGTNITMGCVAGSKATISLVGIDTSTSAALSEGVKIRVQLELSEYVVSDLLTPDAVTLVTPIWVITENKRQKLGGNKYDCTLTAYDLSYIMTKSYTQSYVLTARQAVASIASRYGLTVDSSVKEAVSETDGSTPHLFEPLDEELTDKQMLAYLAGYYGCYAEINEDGEICFSWFSPSDDIIGPDRVFDGGAYVTEMEERTIVLLESGTSDTPLVAPSDANGFSINFENPYMTAEQLNAVCDARIAGDAVSFRIGKVHYKGSPLNNSGTIVTIEDIDGDTATFYIMKRTLEYDGGLSETIECLGESESAIAHGSTSPLQKKISRTLSRMENAIKNATDVITQTKGSIFELIPVDESDPAKGNSGWKLYSTETGSNNVILANSSGIGFSSNGGQSFNAAAIYIDENGTGHINADFIDVGQISADMIDTSGLVVGGVGYDSLEEILDAVIETSNSSVTGIDVLYGQNQSSSTPPVAWSTNAPEWKDGYFIWSKTQTTVNGEITETEPVCITGASGASGRGIKSIVEQYALIAATYTGTTLNSSSVNWAETPPTLVDGYCYWTRNKITWDDGSVTYTDAVKANDYNSVLEKANNAASKVAAWCSTNDTTLIDGGKIYTGSITADKIAAGSITADKLAVGAITAESVNVGWQSGNCATNWYNPNGLNLDTYFTVTSESSDNYYAKVLLKQAYSGTIRCSSKPFYVSNGDTVNFGGTIKNATAKQSGLYLEYSSKSDGSYSVKAYAASSSTTAMAYTRSYKATVSGWYRLTCAFDSPASGSYHSGVYCMRSVRGDMIVNGTIKSTDGLTYFDLDNSALVSENSSGYKTKLTSAGIVSSYGSVDSGGLQPLAIRITDTNIPVAQVLWFTDFLQIGMGAPTNNDAYMQFDSDGIDCLKNVNFWKNITANGVTTTSDNFAGLVHTRTDYGTIKAGVGIVGGLTSAALELSESGSITARIDVTNDTGYAAAKMFLTGKKGRSSPLALGMKSSSGDYSSSLWFNGNLITASSSEKYKSDIQPYTDSALDLVNSSVIYSYKYKHDGDNALTKYGLVIERECPTEIVDNSGDAISLYSMCSILWKAVQELSKKLSEQEVNKNA